METPPSNVSSFVFRPLKQRERLCSTEAPKPHGERCTRRIVAYRLQGDINFNLSGGRMVELDDGGVLLTIGDHAQNVGARSLPQNPHSHYGKTIRIEPDSGRAEVFTIGHRNAEGLHKATDGRIWLTEHGPTGGDELNLIVRGADYGWPSVSYGDKHDESADPGRHTGYQEPVFAWMPSIGVSQLISLQSDLFPSWKGDLLVASLRDQSIFRLRIRDERVAFAERISVAAEYAT
jgi:glucose/arabinose dehydrogenase